MTRRMVVELDADELACRLAEAAFGVTRPPDKSNAEALDTLDRATPMEPMGAAMRRAATSAIMYMGEQAGRAGLVQ